MLKQDFYGLPRSIQDRFIESSQAAAAPAPLAAAPHPQRHSMFWGLGSLVCGLSWAGFTSVGFGDLDSNFALGSLVHRGIHVLFAGGSSFFALKAYALSWAVGHVPYGSGDYLFPAGVVSAKGAELIFFDAKNLDSIEAQGVVLRLVFQGGKVFTFSCPSPENAQKVVVEFKKGRDKWSGLSSSDSLERARLNPLVESGVPNPLAPTQAHLRPQFVGSVAFISLVSVLGLALGLGVSTLRDVMSRKALYKAAISSNTVESYRAYLERGGERNEVQNLLLPRAELDEVVRVGSVEAIESFRSKNPHLEIGGEVQNALRTGLLGELEKAKKVGTLTALKELPQRFKAHELIAVELATARQAVFKKALESFQKEASETKGPELLAFIQQLLTYAQAHGPKVELRIVHEFPQDPRRLDKIVSKSRKYYMGRKSLPTQYFLGEKSRKREEALLKKVQIRLQRAFPKDILEFGIGALPEKENAEPSVSKLPTLTLYHREKLSGGFVGGKPKAMYLGAAILMKGSAEIPGKAPSSFKVIWNAWRSPNFSVLSDSKKDMPDVYEDMMGGVFDKFGTIYLEHWFQKP